ncbi:MAG: copper-translocating P-type ATPase [Gammaproteobacteria bacterium]|nr:copper-translocating P-type ATPase [Gammaproteobacteria bacterium]
MNAANPDTLDAGPNDSVRLPVEGMSCAGCAAGLEKKLRALDGVTDVSVNFALSRADVDFDRSRLVVTDIHEAIRKAGYQVAESPDPQAAAHLRFQVDGMSCGGCAAGLEKKLSALNGVHNASVNFALSRADLDYDPALTGPAQIHQTVFDAGFQLPAQSVTLDIKGMTCAVCAGSVEKALLAVPGVNAAEVNLALEKAVVSVTPDTPTEALIAGIEAAGYSASMPANRSDNQQTLTEESRPVWQDDGVQLVAATLLSAPMVLQMVLMWLGVEPFLAPWMEWLLTTPVQFWIGARFYKGALRAIRTRAGNMDLLVALGTSAAYFFSLAMWWRATPGHLYFESAAVVITLVVLGKWLESRARHSASAAIRELMALRPQTVSLLRDGKETQVPIEQVALDDLVIVRPGERIAVDGIVENGVSDVDESLITGESLPVARQTGDQVTGGSINGQGALQVRVNAVGQDTTLAKVIEIVEKAQSGKAPIQRLVDRVSAVFVPLVLAIAALTFGGWLLSGGSFEQALIAAVSVLVIACPCALGLATPTALVTGTGIAAKSGILIRNIETLERAHKVDSVVFDKTGTLTRGQPEVTDIEVTGDLNETLRLAASLQSSSEHPLARALVRLAGEKHLTLSSPGAFTSLSGLGVDGQVDGRSVSIGNESLLRDKATGLDAFSDWLQAWQAAGKTAVGIAIDGKVSGVLAYADSVRDESAAAVKKLQARGIAVSLLSGDAEPVTRSLAEKVGIQHWSAALKPADKSDVIRKMQSDGRTVAMVGDGVNDAPALALADVGIAMGSGTDVAIESAGVTLLRVDPNLVPAALDIAGATHRKIYQNLFWAFIYNLIGIPLAAFGLLTPAVAGAAMAMSSVSVVSNALLLKRWKPTGRS